MYINYSNKDLKNETDLNGLKKLTIDKSEILHFNTGKFTGRSPKDRYFVKNNYANKVIDFDREGNIGISQETYNEVFEKVSKTITDSNETYFSVRNVSHNENFKVGIHFMSTESWGNVFFNNMFIEDSLDSENPKVKWDIYHVPNLHITEKYDDLKNDNFVIINFETRKILIAGTSYTGEIKKSVFTVLNTILVDEGVLPMHCSANSNNKNGRGVNLFFGLSGTGKTTLSSDPNKFFIGDDEHGWYQNEVFNFEGGCYAKLIGLKKENEPVIWDAIFKDGVSDALLENVVIKDGKLDLTDDTITENIRASYPLSQIDEKIMVEPVGLGNTVENIFFLSFDAYGVLPPISKLTIDGAKKMFALGYTSKVAGTEVGIDEPTLTFSPCFGEPFMPRRIKDYLTLFENKLKENPNINVWLVNTGYDSNKERYALPITRSLINDVIDRNFDDSSLITLSSDMGITVPRKVGNIYLEFLLPEKNEFKKLEEKLRSKLQSVLS